MQDEISVLSIIFPPQTEKDKLNISQQREVSEGSRYECVAQSMLSIHLNLLSDTEYNIPKITPQLDGTRINVR